MSFVDFRIMQQKKLIRKLVCESDEEVTDPEIALIGTVDAREFGKSLSFAVTRVVDKTRSLPFSVQGRIKHTLRESAIMNYGHCDREKTPAAWYGWVNDVLTSFVKRCFDLSSYDENVAFAIYDVLCAFSQFALFPASCGLETGWNLVKFSSFDPSKNRVAENWFVKLTRMLMVKSAECKNWEYAKNASEYNMNLLNVMRRETEAFETGEKMCAKDLNEIRKITGDESLEEMYVPIILDDAMQESSVFFFDSGGPELVSSSTKVVDVENRVCGKRKRASGEEDMCLITSLFPEVKKKFVFGDCREEKKRIERKTFPLRCRAESKRAVVRFDLGEDAPPERLSKHRLPPRIFPYGYIEATKLEFDTNDIDVDPKEVESVSVC